MRKTFSISGIVALLIFVVSSNSFGDYRWISIGPEGGSVEALAIDPQTPDTLYAGTYHGVFKSTNGGTNWTAMNTGLTNPYIRALAINPQTPDTLYAGTYSGVFKSTNGGTNWTAMNTGLTYTDVRALAINPQTPDTLYAGTYGGGVFKSTNDGTNWTATNTGLTNPYIRALAVDPQTPDTVYAGTSYAGVFKLETEYTLTVNINPSASGSVTKNPDKATYVYGEQVTLTATAASGYTFYNWSGDASGTNNPVTLTIDSNKTVAANFTSTSVTPPAYDFGNVKVKKSKTASFVVKNNGKANLSITSTTITGTDALMFKITSGSGSKTIKPGRSLAIKVAFKPISTGSKTANLEITSNDPVAPTIDIPLSGTGQ
jgi:uncharacterized repeat protein (TIGR02543 family)